MDADVDGAALVGLLVGLLLGVDDGVDDGVEDGVDDGDDDAEAVTASHSYTVGVELTLPETTFPPGVDARECGAIATVTTNPAAVVSKTPPVLRPNDPGRTRAKHM